jgi:hypothetical protein
MVRRALTESNIIKFEYKAIADLWSLQFLCHFVVINASEGSLCFQNFISTNNTPETKPDRSAYLPITEDISDNEKKTTTADIFVNAMKVINTNEDLDFNNNERKLSAEE